MNRKPEYSALVKALEDLCFWAALSVNGCSRIQYKQFCNAIAAAQKLLRKTPPSYASFEKWKGAP